MHHDTQLRAAARAIFETVYPTDEWSPVNFEDAELHRTVHYRQAVDAARQARMLLGDPGSQQAPLPL
ncbi:MAG: hypothetical protein KGH96_16185 [Sphingomonadales bacterium]|nr:hypothetical protein [Sphingomonadales bacterium]